MSDDVFQRYGEYYDLLYHDKNYETEAAHIAGALRAAAPNARTVLEFGSGTGRHGRLLAAAGFDVRGVERSAAMVARAAASAAPADARGSFACEQGDIRTVDLRRTFDAVIALFHVVSYQATNAAARATFAAAARHLRPGGVFYFDVWHGPAVLAERPAVRVKRAADARARVTRIAEPQLDTQAGTVTVRYSIFAEPAAGGPLVTFQEEHCVRYFFPTEIALLAEGAGLAVESGTEFLTGRPASDKTWGVAYLLRKLER